MPPWWRHSPHTLTELSQEEEAMANPAGATAIWVILFSWPPRLPRWVPVMSHMWMVESSLEASTSLPDRDTPTLVKLELGVGGLY